MTTSTQETETLAERANAQFRAGYVFAARSHGAGYCLTKHDESGAVVRYGPFVPEADLWAAERVAAWEKDGTRNYTPAL